MRIMVLEQAVIDCPTQGLKSDSRSLPLQSVPYFSTMERKMDDKREEIISTLNDLVDTVDREEEPLEEIDVKGLEEKIQASDSKENALPRQADPKIQATAHESSPEMEEAKFSLCQIEHEYNACLQAGVRSGGTNSKSSARYMFLWCHFFPPPFLGWHTDSEVSSTESMFLESLSKISNHQEAVTVLKKLVIDVSNLLSWRKKRVAKLPDAARQETKLPMSSIRQTLKRAKKTPSTKSQQEPLHDYSQEKEMVNKEFVVQRYRTQNKYAILFFNIRFFKNGINEHVNIPST